MKKYILLLVCITLCHPILTEVINAQKGVLQTTNVNNMESNYGEPAYGLAMFLNLENDKVESGLPVWVKVGITNISTQEVPLFTFDPVKQYSFTIYDSKNKIVAKLQYQKNVDKRSMMAFSSDVYNLKPNESCTYRFNLSRRFDLTATGKYTIQCERKIHKKNKDGKIEFQNLYSKKESFEVIPSTKDCQMISGEQKKKIASKTNPI